MFFVVASAFVSSAVKLSWSSEYSRIVCAIFISLNEFYSFSLGEELVLDFVACVCCVDPVLSHLLFHCSVYVCVCFFFSRLLFLCPTSCFNNRVISSSSLVLLLYSEICRSSGEWLTDDGCLSPISVIASNKLH